MKVLSIHQPWAHAIMHLGKDVENRTWPTSYRGLLAVHASKTMSSYDRQLPAEWEDQLLTQLPRREDLVLGAILGVVDLVMCTRETVFSVWAENDWKWVLANPRILKAPIPFRGQQGLFDLPQEVQRIIMEQLKI